MALTLTASDIPTTVSAVDSSSSTDVTIPIETNPAAEQHTTPGIIAVNPTSISSIDPENVEHSTEKTRSSASPCNDVEKAEYMIDDDSEVIDTTTKTELMTFPDGGFGWLVVVGAFVIQFCQNNIFPGAKLSQIAWSGGIAGASIFITTPFQARMVAMFGVRKVVATGIVISGTGMILASFAKSLWHLYLTQGLMVGLGAGMALFTSVAIPVQWFDKRRGLASGITVAGSGIGGASLAPLNRFMISKVGYQWALRIMGIGVIALVFSILVCLRTRVTLSTHGRPLLDVAMFKNPGFTAMYVMGMLETFGYLTPIALMPSFVAGLGIDPAMGANLISIFSGVNAVARIVLGFVGDHYGPLNVLIISTVFTSLCCWILWMNTHGLAMAIVFMVIYGANAGGFNSLFPVVAANIIGVETLAATVGLLYSGNFFGNLFGTPLASAIVTASGGYKWAQVYAGAAPMLAAILLTILRFKRDRRILVKM
ncbi:hypothetical protein BGZ46_006877 [Entomortierella lignicola]|nr:hypothetical protein BGZ46_006877 [Entomortierella lignicola]